MKSKTPGRVLLNARKKAASFGLHLLQAVEDGHLFFWGTYRYRRVAIGQGLEGLRRVAKENELRAARLRLRNYVRRAYIKENRIGRRRVLALTERGKLFLLRLALRTSPRRRDGKVLIVAFDVPERHAAYRQTLRGILRSCGFVRMQNSVWTTDADVEAPLKRWIKKLGADDWIRLFIAQAL